MSNSHGDSIDTSSTYDDFEAFGGFDAEMDSAIDSDLETDGVAPIESFLNNFLSFGVTAAMPITQMAGQDTAPNADAKPQGPKQPDIKPQNSVQAVDSVSRQGNAVNVSGNIDKAAAGKEQAQQTMGQIKQAEQEVRSEAAAGASDAAPAADPSGTPSMAQFGARLGTGMAVTTAVTMAAGPVAGGIAGMLSSINDVKAFMQTINGAGSEVTIQADAPVAAAPSSDPIFDMGDDNVMGDIANMEAGLFDLKVMNAENHPEFINAANAFNSMVRAEVDNTDIEQDGFTVSMGQALAANGEQAAEQSLNQPNNPFEIKPDMNQAVTVTV
ncbi:MAG: hypothetical protein QF692_01270 [Alphaproteobacteria bacterium]|jgi:hypothetical protein|nr:hypothetical protein [Alphaproteobacteria bacterium]MDP7221873.1 hypothetical protein [Alphaproteobacteria bacterium]